MRITFFVSFFMLIITPINAQPSYDQWDAFLKKYVSGNGEVDYKSIKNNKKELDLITKGFSNTTISPKWSKNDQLAFWINAYNAFTIDLIVQNYPLKSIQNLDGGKTWDVKRISIGGKKYSLNNIENDIIRPQFKDARIHFAVNCGAKSCPPLLNAAFVGKTLDIQLDNQTKKFINDKKFQNLTTSNISISKIFEWYSVDFGNLLNFINRYSTARLEPNVKISYMAYDWALNSK